MPGLLGICDWLGAQGGAAHIEAWLHGACEGTSVFGPDGRVQFVSERCGLVQMLDYHTEESTQVKSVVRDLSRGTALVADLRIDNRKAIGQLLELDSVTLDTLSDEALVLLGYGTRGDLIFEQLEGDFFVAIWDEPNRALTLVRDGLGVKPGVYARLPEGVVFGSMVPWVLRHRDVSRNPNRRRIADFIGLSFEDRESTFYEHIQRIPPGTLIRFGPGGVSRRTYYELKFQGELKLKDNREYAARFRSLLVDAVGCRFRARVEPAVLLSGGLDSSSIVGCARELGFATEGRPLSTISALFPDYPHIDESAWIEEVIARGAIRPAFVRVDRRTPLEFLGCEIERYGEPFYSPNNYVDSTLLDAAQAAGTRIVIDGLDGDTTVGHGWEYLGELLRRGKVRRMVRLARELARHTDRSALWFIMRHAVMPTLIGLCNVVAPGRTARAPRLMNRSFAEQTGFVERVRKERAPWTRAQLSSFREQHFGKLTSGLLPASFELAWRQAAVRGMQRRHPYFDRRLVEFCLSLPAEQRLARGVDRIVQRRAVEGLVPENIRTRLTKSIWTENTADRVRNDERSKLVELAELRDSRVGEFVEMSVVRAACRQVLEGSADQRTVAEIWVVCALRMWLSSMMRP
jgi:asparagine synthase (glutamine-hydrolysing)